MKLLVCFLAVCMITSAEIQPCMRQCQEKDLVFCLINPCNTPEAEACKPKDDPGAVCIDNYCKGCNFCWKKSNGMLVNCQNNQGNPGP